MLFSSKKALLLNSFPVHHPVNRDDRHLRAHAMAPDITVAWQFSQTEQLVFSLWIKIHALLKINLVYN
jgi:hypothetical protein